MSTISDDVEHLISRLAGPLSPRDRAAFRRAAEDALARVPCWGEGAVYRAVASLQRAFRDPPTDGRAHWDIEQELRPPSSRALRRSNTAAISAASAIASVESQ